jgi:hypothetical protein
MTQPEFIARIEALIAEARHEGLSDKALIEMLEHETEALAGSGDNSRHPAIVLTHSRALAWGRSRPAR